jgi:hypothetical protein
MDRSGTRMTLNPVIKPLREADVKTSPQAWVKKAPNQKNPMMVPGFRNSFDHDRRLDQPTGKIRRQANKKRIKRKLAGEVSTRASFTMAKEVPQKMETPSKTPSAARCEEEDVSILAKPSPRFLEWKPLYQWHPPRINQNR